MNQYANIRQAIRDVLEGATGRYATRIAGMFVHGAFEGQPEQALAAAALKSPHSYDVVIGEVTPHEASPAGVIGSHSLKSVALKVRVSTRLPDAASEAKRITVTTGATADMDLAALCLGEPDALTTTAAGDATGIVSGLLRSPDGTGYPDVSEGQYDWPNHIATHEIRARAVVRFDRP